MTSIALTLFAIYLTIQLLPFIFWLVVGIIALFLPKGNK